MKKTENNGRTIKITPRTKKTLSFVDVHHQTSPLWDRGISNLIRYLHSNYLIIYFSPLRYTAQL